MTTRPIDDALDYIPSAATRRMAETVALLKAYTIALGEGRAAHETYKSLIAQGMDPSDAARRVFEKSFGRA